MITFASKFTDDFKAEISASLLEGYSFFIKKSFIVGENRFTLECRVNVDSKDDIDKLLLDIGRKSGSTYNKLRGDSHGKGTTVIVSGTRKCHHAVKRHSLKDAHPHSGPG